MKITGTFLDEITHDIPSQNWGPEEWAADFSVMRQIGIDTVIIIRSGYREQAVFNSWSLGNHRKMLTVRDDLGRMFLDLAEANGMQVFWGIYDPGDWQSDVNFALEVNREFTREVHQQYGQHAAFGGWYITFELSQPDPSQVGLVTEIARHVKSLNADVPTLISPYIPGSKAGLAGGAPTTLKAHEARWRPVFQQLRDCIDIVAFQDGQVDYLELGDYLRLNLRLVREAGLQCWSNIEAFDRDMPVKFPPLDWRKLEFKLDEAREAGVDKLITFDFAHFMSPHSSYTSARHLFWRYCERFGLKVKLPRTPTV